MVVEVADGLYLEVHRQQINNGVEVELLLKINLGHVTILLRAVSTGDGLEQETEIAENIAVVSHSDDDDHDGQGAFELVAAWGDVAIAHCGDGDDGPVQSGEVFVTVGFVLRV